MDSTPGIPRVTARSVDGGESWELEPSSLPSPRVHGSSLQIAGDLLFVNPACSTGGHTERRHLTIRRSPDGGRSWTHRKIIRRGSAGYSDLVLTDGGIGVLYEAPMGDGDAEQLTTNSAARYDETWVYSNGITFAWMEPGWLERADAQPFYDCDTSVADEARRYDSFCGIGSLR